MALKRAVALADVSGFSADVLVVALQDAQFVDWTDLVEGAASIGEVGHRLTDGPRSGSYRSPVGREGRCSSADRRRYRTSR